METIKKQTIRLGNSAGVLLPREWLNSIVEVKLLKTPITKEAILKDLNIYLKDYLENIFGIYLIGSYARGDYDENSDIDVLVITDKINKSIKKNNYEIILISEDNLLKKLFKNLYLISGIRESEPIINKRLLEKFKEIKPKINIKEHKKEIESVLAINKDMIDTAKEYNQNVLDGTIYSLVLRLRELYLIKCIINDKKTDKKEFLKHISKKTYEAYLRVKRDEKEINDISPDNADKLYELTEKWLKDLKE
jgi:predicted nucleotidyltransferase